MSDIHNHLLCAEHAYNNSDTEFRKIIEKNRVIFDLGSLGGDLFYYFSYTNKKAHDWATSIGHIFHSNVNQFFSDARAYLLKLDAEEKQILTTYLYGFITHHALDSRTHPFINSFSQSKYKSPVYDSFLHKRFEVVLDIIYTDYLNVPFPDTKHLQNITKKEIAVLTDFYQYQLSCRKETLIPDDMLITAIQDLGRLMKTSKNKLVYRVMIIADLLIGKKKCLSRPFFILTNQEKLMDALNLTRDFWCDPDDCHVKSNFTYPELFSYAVKDSVSRIKQYSDYLNGVNKTPENIFCGLSF